VESSFSVFHKFEDKNAYGLANPFLEIFTSVIIVSVHKENVIEYFIVLLMIANTI
jgi:hypothetical protein